MKPPTSVLICRTDRIGDVVLTLPMARAIKKAYPECRVGFLVREYTVPLVVGHPYIDEVHTARESQGVLQVGENALRLRARSYDTAIAVYPTPRIAMTLFRAGIPRRVGTRYRWFSPLFTERVKMRRRVSPQHELEHNLRLLAPLGINGAARPGEVEFDLQADPEALAQVESVLAAHQLPRDRPRIVVHPGSGGSAVDLPEDMLVALVERLSQERSVSVLITGSPAEQSLAARIAEKTGGVNLAGCFDLQGLTALLSTAALVLANSTGPIHIAAALGTPVLGFYSRARSCGPERWGPYSLNSRVLTPSLDCSGCTLAQCHQRRCMTTVDLDAALEAAHELLEPSAPSP